MSKVTTDHLKFSINRTPYELLHMPASASIDEEGNETSRREARWVMKPYMAGTYTIGDDNAADVMAHLKFIEKKKAELSDAETELASEILKIAESSRLREVTKAEESVRHTERFVYDLKHADKDREIASIVKRFLEEAK